MPDAQGNALGTRDGGTMPTDTERLDWYFGQDRFEITKCSTGPEVMLEAADVPGLIDTPSGCCLWPTAREAIDHAMKLEKDDA